MESELVLLIVAALLIIVVASVLSRRLGIATPILLVPIGLGASMIPGAPSLSPDPEWILAVVLPPILYSAAVNVPLVDFRRNLMPIGWLSVLLVIVSALASGTLFYWLLPDLSLAGAIALGAVVSPPDAVAATSVGRRLGLPQRLMTVLEGEGLVNDATALVLLRSAVAAISGGFAIGGVIGDFFYAVALAIVIGAAIGLLSVRIRARVDDPVLNTALSFAVPFVSFGPTEHLGASGVLAVVVTGLITGHESARRFSAVDRISERTNWRTAQLVLENGVFLLMGYELRGLVSDVIDAKAQLWTTVGIGLLACVLLIVVRAAFVVPLIALLRRQKREVSERRDKLDLIERAIDRLEGRADSQRITGARRRIDRRRADLASLAREGLGWRGGAVIAWSGMRGVVTLAAAQSLPQDLPYRSQVILIAFVIAFVTLLGQGLSLPWLIKKLGIGAHAGAQDEARRLVEELTVLAQERLRDPELRRADGGAYAPAAVERVVSDLETRSKAFRERMEAPPDGEFADYLELRGEAIEAQRLALLDMRSSSEYSSATIAAAQRFLDGEESRLGSHGEGH